MRGRYEEYDNGDRIDLSSYRGREWVSTLNLGPDKPRVLIR